MKVSKQQGFTLVEIAIVLVIIGLLLGSILKGQELINSARVRNLANQNSGVQAAYYGFIDRYRQIPGDMTITAATPAIGAKIYNGGNGNGGVDNTFTEAAGVWEQLTRSNFLSGGFQLPVKEVNGETIYNIRSPVNAYNAPLILTINDGYTGIRNARLNLHLGKNIPVNIARELDLKLDDGLPNTGVIRLTNPESSNPIWSNNKFQVYEKCTAQAGADSVGATAGDGTLSSDIYDVFADEKDCGQVFLY